MVNGIELNNADTVVEKSKKEPFSEEFCRPFVNESGTGKVTISEKSIEICARDIVDLFDEK